MAESRDLDARTAYDAWAATYDAQANPTVAAAREVLAAWLPDPAGLDVVELGCGTGGNLTLLRGARSLTGLDLSEGMLARARAAVPGADLRVADLTEPLPLADGCADRVLISLVVEHLPAPAALVAEAARLLRAGGRLLLVELHPDRRARGKRARFEQDGVTLQPPSFPHSRGDLCSALEGAGLRLRVVRDGPRVLALEGQQPDAVQVAVVSPTK